MSKESKRWMRLLVLFDLPVTTTENRRIYTSFRKFLLKDGYDMLQFSVYARLCNGLDAVDKHYQRLLKHLPKKGSIRCLQVTDKQYAGMKFLVGEPTKQQKKVNTDQLLLF